MTKIHCTKPTPYSSNDSYANKFSSHYSKSKNNIMFYNMLAPARSVVATMLQSIKVDIVCIAFVDILAPKS